MRERAYFDYNATAPLLPVARAAMLSALDLIGNPSSVHADGRRARAAIEAARQEVAALVGGQAAQVVFSASATEACNAILADRYDVVLLSGLEHACIWTPAQASGARVVEVAVGPAGVIDLDDLERKLAAIEAGKGRGLLCIQLANNETGVVQPVAEAAAMARSRGLDVLCDAVQAAGRMPVDLPALGVDALVLSAHKMGGPKGAGAIVAASGWAIPALVRGGGQERGRRGGTENVAAIAGFGAAARWWLDGRLDDWHAAAGLRDLVCEIITDNVPGARIMGAGCPRLANTICFTWPGQRAETLVIRFDLAGVSLSAGAACSSGKVATSRVLTAMGVPAAEAASAVRLSFGPSVPEPDLQRFFAALVAIRGEAAGEPVTLDELPAAVRRRLDLIAGET